MKYGLHYFKNTDNIGDDIQCFAAMQYLPSIDCYINREELDTFEFPENPHETIAAIMNGWYMHCKYHWPPSRNILPLWVSMHISQFDFLGVGTRFLDGLGGEYLKHYAPIGARDISTLHLLHEKGIDAYFSGCLTLTINLPSNESERSEILLVDVSEEDEKQILTQYPTSVFTRVSHDVDPDSYSKIPIEERLISVKQLLQRYQQAKCVITSRLHCALPCLALQTPVLLIYKPEYQSRMESFLPLLHVTTPEELSQTLASFHPEHPPRNKETYLPIRKSLRDQCFAFIEKCQSCPIPPCFNASDSAIASWQRVLSTDMDLPVRRYITELSAWTQELEKGKEWNVQQRLNYQKENSRLEGIIAEQRTQIAAHEVHIASQETRIFEQQAIIDTLNHEIDIIQNELQQLHSSLYFRLARKVDHFLHKIKLFICQKQ